MMEGIHLLLMEQVMLMELFLPIAHPVEIILDLSLIDAGDKEYFGIIFRGQTPMQRVF